jgi:hypothetical protein
MVYKIDKLRWLNRITDDFDGENITVKLMKGTVPTIAEGQEFTPTSRDTDLLASFTVQLDGAGKEVSTVGFTPTATGDVTWAKIIFGSYVITTDQIGLIRDTNKVIWLSTKSLTTGTQSFLQAIYISMTGVA